MARLKMAALLLALAAATAMGRITLYAQEHEKVNSPNAVHDQTARHYQEAVKALTTMGTPETPFDFIPPALSGPWSCSRASRSTGPSRTAHGRRPRGSTG
jgi:hypothetical protein